MRIPPDARHTTVISAAHEGVVATIDNRRLARLAKLTGALRAPAAGLELHVRLGSRIEAGKPPVHPA